VKKVFLLTLLLLVFVGSALAASEEDIMLLGAAYEDGTAVPDVTSIEPYRSVRLVFQFLGGADKASVITKHVLPEYTETVEEAPAEGKRVTVQCTLPSGLEVILTAIGTYGGEEVTRSFSIKAREGGRPGIPVTGIYLLDPADATKTPQQFIRMTLKKGDSEKIYYQITPEDATNQDVTIESSDANIAEVSGSDATGIIVTATGKGTTYVSFTAKDGGLTATCEVTVTETSAGGSGGGCNASVFGILGGIAIGFAEVTMLKKHGLRYRQSIKKKDLT
jgi:hypothetical protein